MKKFDVQEVMTPAIDYLLLGEVADLALADDIKEKYEVTRDALLDLISEFNLAVLADSEDPYSVGAELAYLCKEEAKDIIRERSEVFQEACKKKAKKSIKEFKSIEEAVHKTVDMTLNETALYTMLVMPAILEGTINPDSMEGDIYITAARTLIEELVEIAAKYEKPCCK